MVCMKRPYPFSLDNPSGPSVHCKYPPLGHHPINNISSELPSYGNGNTLNLDTGIPVFREGTSCSIAESSSKRGNNKSRVNSCSDFLSLAPPTSSSTINRPSADYCNSDCSQFEALPYQASVEDSEIGQGSSQVNQKKPYFSFIPPAIGQTGQATAGTSNCNGGGDEGRESVDLNLKL